MVTDDRDAVDTGIRRNDGPLRRLAFAGISGSWAVALALTGLSGE